MIGQGILLDDLIAQLQKLREKHGNVQCFTSGGEYPDGTGTPFYNAKAHAYLPADIVIIP